jgi:hypothetical protein
VQRRKEGKCFHCDDLFSNGHKFVCKQLFVIEVILADALEQTTNVANLMTSLHVLTGIHPRSGKTMQLLLVVNGVQLRALFDSGSTHNFIDSAAADRAAMPFQECAGLRVAVANDDRFTSLGRCQGLHLDVAGEVFCINCYGLAPRKRGYI